jgi:glycosyltransferase involved in cell wall biosynthesis
VVAGVRELAAQRPELLDRLELVFAGRRTPQQDAALDQLNDLSVAQVRLPFVSHDEAIGLMRDADALLLLNADKPHTHRIVNAKTFEYMAARRPMFVVAPEGDLWDVVRDLPGTALHRPDDPAGIAHGLAAFVEQHAAGRRFAPDEWRIARFERRRLTAELAQLLNETVGRGAEKAEGSRSASSGDRRTGAAPLSTGAAR